MNAMATQGLSVLSIRDAEQVVGGECSCDAYCIGRTIGKALRWFHENWPGSITHDWTQK